jgi:hypothetical protein
VRECSKLAKPRQLEEAPPKVKGSVGRTPNNSPDIKRAIMNGVATDPASAAASCRPQFANPDTNFSSSTFGVIASTAVNPRVGQLALTFAF